MRRGYDFPARVAEAALAHAVGDMTERAYRRGDALEQEARTDGCLGSILRAKGAVKRIQF